jgi:hypothetical protein
MKFTIDTANITKLVQDADRIFLAPEAEKNLIELLELRAKVEVAIDEAKVNLEAAALKSDPNFSSLSSDNIKIYYRAFGSRWSPDMALIDYLPKDYYSIETKIKLDPKKIEKHIKDTGKVPAGITEIERKKQLTFSYKSEVQDEQ